MKRLAEVRRFVDTVLTCTGELTGADHVPLWTGKCLIYPRDLDARQVEAGGREWTVTRYNVVLPAHTPARIGHRLRVTASPDEPGMVGLAVVLVDVPLNAWTVARLCVAEIAT